MDYLSLMLIIIDYCGLFWIITLINMNYFRLLWILMDYYGL